MVLRKDKVTQCKCKYMLLHEKYIVKL